MRCCKLRVASGGHGRCSRFHFCPASKIFCVQLIVKSQSDGIALTVNVMKRLPMNKKRIVLAGGSGFLGHALSKELLARNYEVVVLTRAPRMRADGVKEIQWDAQHVGSHPW